MKAARRLALAAVLLTAAAGWAQETYDLSKTPDLNVGDVGKNTVIFFGEGSLRGPEGESQVEQRREVSKSFEVLEVSDDGEAERVRVTIENLTQEAATTTREEKYSSKTSVEDIRFVAVREGEEFRADTTSVVSSRTPKLNAMQFALVEEQLLVSLDEKPETLMPESPVPVGHTWKPDTEKIESGMRHPPSAWGLRFTGAELKLAKVESGVAHVVGVLTGMLQGVMETGFEFTFRIDLETGHLLAGNGVFAFEHSVDGKEVRADMRCRTASTLERGKGKPSVASKAVFGLGWPEPPPDRNSVRDTDLGISIEPPMKMKRIEGAPPGGVEM